MQIMKTTLLTRKKHNLLPLKLGMLLVFGTFNTGIAWLIPYQSPSIAQACNPFGCPNPGAGECNPFGCPNPGAGQCTPFGCPASPSRPPSGNVERGDSNRSGKGDCMDRVMYMELHAQSGPDRDGDYYFSIPYTVDDQAKIAAGFNGSYNKQSVVRVQVKSPEEAAAICRE